MNDIPRRYRRGDTSPERPGMLFQAYKLGKEYWVTPQQFENNTRRAKEFNRLYYQKYPEREKSKRQRWLSKSGSLDKKKKSYNSWVNSPIGRLTRRKVTRRYLQTTNGQIINRVRSRIAVALKRGCTKSNSTLGLIGCSIRDFKLHLESQFEYGMTWENTTKWEIDHRVPLSSFNLADPEQQKLAFNFHNCRPMWKQANRKKSDKIEGELFRGRELRKIIPFKAA